jgi:hypothetical protein
MKPLNALIIGGSGNWCNQSHLEAILALKLRGYPLQVTAICDPVPPSARTNYQNLAEIVELDNPIHFFATESSALFEKLTSLHASHVFDFVIIACDPIFHYDYCRWAANLSLPVICDKPLVLTQDAAWNLSAAQQIQIKYEELQQLCLKNKTEIILPLGRRNDSVFIGAIRHLRETYEQTGEGISYLHLLANQGVKRFKQEFLHAGSHGYISGAGSGSHTFYHFLDIIAWFLQNAPGKTTRMKLVMPYIYRVQNYLHEEKYRHLQHALNDPNLDADVTLPLSVLAAEYDFNLQLHLLDENNHPTGMMQVFSSHSGYSNRTSAFQSEIECPEHFAEGGRMKQFYLDIHQGSVQNIQIHRNNKAFEKYKAYIYHQVNPLLKKSGTSVEEDYFESELTNEKQRKSSVVTLAIKKLLDLRLTAHEQQSLSGFHNQALTQKIFSCLYEMMAYQYQPREVVPDFNIEIKDYFQESNIK